MDGIDTFRHAVIRAQDDDGEPCAGAPIALPPDPPEGENWTADARLIAAAPDLLHACKYALHFCDDSHVRAVLSAAITRVQGGEA
jgi:hypothetical protein